MEKSGWSAEYFVEHAKHIFPRLAGHDITYKLGRNVLHLMKNGRKLKIYPHYNGRTNDFLTVTEKKNELHTFEKSSTPESILEFIVKTLNEKIT